MIQTVLIADSDSGVREQLKWCLRMAGYQVVTAQNRFETMAALMARRINLMLLDVAMAGDGAHAVLNQLSRGGHFDRVPVLLLTDGQIDAPREFAAMRKPVASTELLAMVNGMIGPPGRGHSARVSGDNSDSAL